MNGLPARTQEPSFSPAMILPGKTFSAFLDTMRALSLSLVIAMCACTPNTPKDATEDPLSAARRLAAEGNFEQALEKHVWIHNHALEVNPGYYGVRLSFALSEWVELGSKYPKALATLKSIRDEKTARLLAGDADRELFHDVASINDYLKDTSATVELFKKLDGTHPEFAVSVFDLADESLIAAREYALAKKYLGDPMKRFATAKQRFDQGMKYAASSRMLDASRKAYENIFTKETVGIITLLDKTGDSQLAREVQSKALAVLNNPAIRNSLTSESQNKPAAPSVSVNN